ncbi:MAG: SMC-Scp complex subunit ScpB [Alphaproteobacteria bacterium]
MTGAPNREDIRIIEALLFASSEPLDEADLLARVPGCPDLGALLTALQDSYRERGVNLTKTGNRWAFRTAPDLAGALRLEQTVQRRLSRAAIETLAVIAYHQPVTRAEIEDIRGVSQSRGSLDVLLEAGWVRPGRRRQTPGRPLTWLTTDALLDHFGLEDLKELPGLDELKAAGLLDARPAGQAFRGDQMELLSEENPEEESNESINVLGQEESAADEDDGDPGETSSQRPRAIED